MVHRDVVAAKAGRARGRLNECAPGLPGPIEPFVSDRPRAAEYYRKAADFVHTHADQYSPKMEIYLRKRVTEFKAPPG